jgi:hypothetical protein
MIMLILSIAVFVATLATPVVVLALWQHFEARELYVGKSALLSGDGGAAGLFCYADREKRNPANCEVPHTLTVVTAQA